MINMGNKKKIGIVTITNDGYNFGNRLQNYALQTVLERMGYDVETLIGDETKDVGQISYKINDKSYKELLKNILKDIKKDARAKEIVSLIYPKFEDLKVNEKKHYLKNLVLSMMDGLLLVKELNMCLNK